jgi:hypothetical protein
VDAKTKGMLSKAGLAFPGISTYPDDQVIVTHDILVALYLKVEDFIRASEK